MSSTATAMRTWDYVALGDSIPAGAGDVAGKSFVYDYARHIEQDTGVRIAVHNLATDGGTTGDLLAQMQHDADTRTLLGDAEVVTISIGVNDLEMHLPDYAGGACGGSDNQKCFRSALALFKGPWNAILSEVLRMRANRPTIIRVTNDYNPFPGNAAARANLGERTGKVFTHYLRGLNDYRCSTAQQKEIPCADVALAFNGPGTDASAFAKGLIGTDQFAHPSAKGHQLIAQTLRQLGYAPLAEGE
jgi:lysophospholipase L1-like esterase